MDNLKIHNKNKIYKIYSKINDSYTRFVNARDGLKLRNYNETENQIKLNILTKDTTKEVKQNVQNKSCNKAILCIYKRKWYGEEWIKFYRLRKPANKECAISLIKIIDSKKIILSYYKRQNRLAKRKEWEWDIISRWNDRKKRDKEKNKRMFQDIKDNLIVYQPKPTQKYFRNYNEFTQILKIREYIKKNGERKTAIKLVSDTIYIHCGMVTSELPETEQLCNMYDEIEELLKIPIIVNSRKIRKILDSINFDFVENLIHQ